MNSNLISENDVKNKKKLKIFLNNENKESRIILVDNYRKILIIKEINILFLEIYPEKDNINFFIQLDDINYNKKDYIQNIYSNHCIYTLKKNTNSII